MTFQIPENLDQFSVAGLEDLRRIAKGEYDTLKSTVDIATITDEELTQLEELQGFVFSTVPAEIASRTEKQERFAAATTEPGDGEEAEEEAEEEEAAEEPEAVTASSKVTVKSIKANSGSKEIELPFPNRVPMSTLVAAAGVPGYDNGQVLGDMLDVAKIFEARSASHQSMDKAGMQTNGPVQMPVATLIRNYPDEFSVNGDQTDYDKLLKVADESRLPGGSLLASVELDRKRLAAEQPQRDSLVAAAGWCAPSETDYSICMQITTDGLADWPEVQARRGGIRHNTGIDWGTLFSGGTPPPAGTPGGTGYFNLTEAQVASATTKTCLEIPCPSFTDTRLGVTGLCLTGNILSIRGYPEYTATFVRGATAASAHQVNREQVAAVVAGSTAVDLTAVAPWATDGSTISQVMSAVDMAIVDIKYRLRMQRSATLEVIMPWWVLAQMRADMMRRPNSEENFDVTDAMISQWYATRNARVQYVYDWQDAFSSAALSGTGPGATTPIGSLPKSLQFLVYPAGTWVRAVSDVITLNSVYDSTKLATNQVTHLFTETGWAMVQMCPVSRVYTVPICPSGKTTSTGTLTCP